MRIIVAVLLLAGCSAPKAPEAPDPPAGQLGADVAEGGGQSRGTIPGQAPAQGKSDAKDAAAKIMAGGFRPDGSFVHGDHIHQAGQEKCPSEMNGGPVL